MIKTPNGYVLFLGGWRKWVPTLVVWFTPKSAIELRGSRWQGEWKRK